MVVRHDIVTKEVKKAWSASL